jgi:hypothetical protein
VVASALGFALILFLPLLWQLNHLACRTIQALDYLLLLKVRHHLMIELQPL